MRGLTDIQTLNAEAATEMIGAAISKAISLGVVGSVANVMRPRR